MLNLHIIFCAINHYDIFPHNSSICILQRRTNFDIIKIMRLCDITKRSILFIYVKK